MNELYYNNFIFEEYVRVMINNDEVIIGNIAHDGRWIKLKKDFYDRLKMDIDSTKTKKIESNKIKLLKTLKGIKVIGYRGEKTSNVINEITLELTTQCNLICNHCSYSFGGNKNFVEMPLSTIAKVSSWCERIGVERIILTGGEIFCRNDIYSIIKLIRNKFSGDLDIITNGTLIPPQMINLIEEKITRISISLDGYDEESVTKIRGKNVFNKVIKLIDDLKNRNIEIYVSCVDTNDNLNKIKKFKEFANSKKAKPIIRQLNLKGRAKKNYLLQDDFFYNNVMENELTFKCICDVLHKSLFISVSGEVFPCAALREKEESICDLSSLLDATYVKKQNIKAIVDLIKECKQCNVRYFCSDTCMSMNNEIYTDENLKIKRCKSKYKKLKTTVW